MSVGADLVSALCIYFYKQSKTEKLADQQNRF